jgi:hypothetical protein
LLDVIPLSLGIETRGGLFTKLLDRNSTIPTKKSLVFTTVADNQQVVEVHVLQGERDIAAGNRSLARFELVGIPAAPRGLPQVEVTFEVDADGIVSVSARDKMTGLEQAMRITPSSGLSASEIYDLIEEANRNVETDRRMREIIIARNRLEGLLQNTVRSFGEFGWMLRRMTRSSCATPSNTPATRSVGGFVRGALHAGATGKSGSPYYRRNVPSDGSCIGSFGEGKGRRRHRAVVRGVVEFAIIRCSIVSGFWFRGSSSGSRNGKPNQKPEIRN